MARSRSKSMKRSKIRKSGVKKYSRSKQRYRRKKTRTRGKPKKQQEGGMARVRKLVKKGEPEPSPITPEPRPITPELTFDYTERNDGFFNKSKSSEIKRMADISFEYIGGKEKFLVGFSYDGKPYSITGSELIEFCKLADPKARPKAPPDYGENLDYLSEFRKAQKTFKERVKPEIIQQLEQVPSMIKKMSQRELEGMKDMLGRLFWVIMVAIST